MKIDRSNYEIWFIDWLDGNLDSRKTEQLNLFLNENPDLKREFNDLTPVIIQHSDHLYKNKESLKKSMSDISDSQFEYLCIAHLENDLSPDQEKELKGIIEKDAEKKKTFTLIQKTRISPLPIEFKLKSNLIKRTPLQKVIRLSVIGLSSAAAIILMISLLFNSPAEIDLTISNSAEIIIPENNIQKPAVLKKESIKMPVGQKNVAVARAELSEIIPIDSSEQRTGVQNFSIDKVNFTLDIALNKNLLSNALIASGVMYTVPEEDDGRSNIGRFISKTFREKLLKETILPNTPLKGYEIAEAGVTGLNKLLGWEMALDKNNDENGELNSVYFSSKLLKFNSPVKKNEPRP